MGRPKNESRFVSESTAHNVIGRFPFFDVFLSFSPPTSPLQLYVESVRGRHVCGYPTSMENHESCLHERSHGLHSSVTLLDPSGGFEHVPHH